MDIIHDLNEAQREAVRALDGPVLVVAGPGTGKTLTIVRRIANLVRRGARPERVLAVTFTNRAAREMRERTHALLGDTAERIFIGTFHFLGLRIIQARQAGQGSGFSLLNRDEQVELIKPLIKGTVKKARDAVERISRIKNFLDEPTPETAGLFAAYQDALIRQNALDFDDLVRIPVELFETGNAPEAYRSRFSHIIVDEYQDINPVQYRLLKLLAADGNICAVGDSDQAIYSFRGADVGNFLNFEGDFSGARRIHLGLNYRSSATVLQSACAMIANNRKRIAVELQATREKGSAVAVVSAPDEKAEAEAIIRELETRIGGTSHYQMYQNPKQGAQGEAAWRFSDFAVIFRTNAQARAIEEAFIASGIPYQLVGRKSSLRKKELEETLAYLRSFLPEEERAAAGGDSNEEKLLAPADYFDPRADAVALMTMHMAKGLEFRVVFIAGCEEGLVPYTLMNEPADTEEERRLFYVGMTRARDELYLLHSRNRFLFGGKLSSAPSPFIAEIPEVCKSGRVIPDRPRKEKPQDAQLGLF